MLRQLKTITVRLVAAANVAVALALLATAYADRLDPAAHPVLANMGLVFPLCLVATIGLMVFFLVFHRRYALISVVALVACAGQIRTYCPLNIPSSVPDSSITVMSYNVYSWAHDYAAPDHPNPILEYILASNADIVCLQEALYGNYVAQHVHEYYDYIDSVQTKGGMCLTIFSRYPIIGKEKIEYSSRANASAAFQLLMDGDTVTVVNNHFETTGLSLEDRAVFRDIVKGHSEMDTMKTVPRRLLHQLGSSAKVRAKQADAVAAYVRQQRLGSSNGINGNDSDSNNDSNGGENASGHHAKPVILCGDFNDNPLSYTHRTLAKELTDCYVSAGNGPGISYHCNAMYVRIDNILCSNHFTPLRCWVDPSIPFSDHYPIICKLKR